MDVSALKSSVHGLTSSQAYMWQGQGAAADRLERPKAGGEEPSASSSPSSRLLLADDFQNIQLLAPALGFAEALPGPSVPVWYTPWLKTTCTSEIQCNTVPVAGSNLVPSLWLIVHCIM